MGDTNYVILSFYLFSEDYKTSENDIVELKIVNISQVYIHSQYFLSIGYPFAPISHICNNKSLTEIQFHEN